MRLLAIDVPERKKEHPLRMLSGHHAMKSTRESLTRQYLI